MCADRRPSFPADTTIAGWLDYEPVDVDTYAYAPVAPQALDLAAQGWEFGTIDTWSGSGNGNVPRYGYMRRTVPNPVPQTGGQQVVNHLGGGGSVLTPSPLGVNQAPSKAQVTGHCQNTLWAPKVGFDSSPAPALNPGASEDAAWLMPQAAAPLATAGSALASWTEIPSIQLMRGSAGECLTLAYDTEYYEAVDAKGGKVRLLLCWQFAFLNPGTGMVEEVVVYSLDEQRLRFGTFVSWLVDEYGLSSMPCCGFGSSSPNGIGFERTRRWTVPVMNEHGERVEQTFRTRQEAIAETCDDEVRDYLRFKSTYEYLDDGTLSIEFELNKYGERIERRSDWGLKRDHDKDGEPLGPAGYENDFRDFHREALHVTLLFHSGKNDLSAFDFSEYEKDLLIRASDVQGGLVSLRDVYMQPPSCREHRRFYPICLSIRDTMCFAPDGKKSLAALGEAVGVPKLDVGADKGRMQDFLVAEPVDFMEYAIEDAVVTLAYASELWGWNREMPVTVTSAAAKLAKNVIEDNLGDVNGSFRGLHRVSKGLAPRMGNKPGYLEETALEPLNEEAALLQRAAQNAYHGGWNGCVRVGYYDIVTHDHDLMNAYPTCMALVPDIDWFAETGKVVYREWHAGERLTLQDFRNPFDPIFGYVEFAFPDGVKYPCIPVNEAGSLVFPRTSEGLDGVYASGPEIYLALRLGADVRVSRYGRVYQGAYKLDGTGRVSRSLFWVVYQLVNDRALAQEVFGKGSLADLLLKIAVNSIYGKLAQDVVDKRTWDAFIEEMTNIGGSAITSPTHACLATAGVRAVLAAAMNELEGMGYACYSVTTDGFITDASLDVMDTLDLYGLSGLFRQSRSALTGDGSMWSEKHTQQDLVNASTRCNVSLSAKGVNNYRPDGVDDEVAGVCAHNSFVTGYEKDSFEDRLAFMTGILSRTGKLRYSDKKWPGFRELAARRGRRDFVLKDRTRALSMDFDLKRKPIRDSFSTVHPKVEGVVYEIANFDTEPYENIEEYRRYKAVGRWASEYGCLRTEADWERFFFKLDSGAQGKAFHVEDMDWKVLQSCVRGWRFHGWAIPFLDGEHSVEEKIAFINAFNVSRKEFRRSDWDNASRRARQNDILPLSMCEDLLDEMRACGDAMPDTGGQQVVDSIAEQAVCG